ncbi:MAG: DNA-directed DNA polymerase [Actinobacteria bacterium 66_15]|nr:MAG: DNA-directed DNA polymerase [Actinobacteria bacterium 66_15]
MPAYDNAAVATALDDFGDLLEIAGEDRYRFLSYHKAAHAVRAWDEDIMSTALADRLTEIPGIGAKIASVISSLLEKGTFPEYEEVVARVPASVVELMRIQGVGPKKAKALYDDLGIISVDDLEEALDEGRLEGLSGFGAKTIDNIAEGVRRYRELSERILLADALPLASKLVEELKALRGVEQAEYAGSIRRMKETVGDIDVLVAARDGAAVMEAVRDLPVVTEVFASGETKTSVMTTSGRQADVRVVDPGCWGAALQYFTGSAEHNVHLREIAKSRGLKINEYGVFRIEDDQRLECATEADVYAALGMPVMPPEIREDAGEIELALDGRVPDLVTREDIRGDLHSHTVATDGRSTLEENRQRAATLGYEYLGCSDHAYELRMVGGLDLADLERQWERIDELNALDDGGPVLLKGIELNIDDDGGVDYPDDVLARFDYCIASLHHGFSQSREQATHRLIAAMDNPFVDIIGHPTGRLLGRRDPFDLDMEAVIEKAAETGTALELNAHPERLDLNDVHLRMARKAGVRVVIDTDAHEATQFSHMRWGVATARRGWVSPSMVLNTLPLDDLLASLRRNRQR